MSLFEEKTHNSHEFLTLSEVCEKLFFWRIFSDCEAEFAIKNHCLKPRKIQKPPKIIPSKKKRKNLNVKFTFFCEKSINCILIKFWHAYCTFFPEKNKLYFRVFYEKIFVKKLSILFWIKEKIKKNFIYLLKTFLFFSHQIISFFLTIWRIIITKLYIFILLFYISQEISENLIWEILKKEYNPNIILKIFWWKILSLHEKKKLLSWKKLYKIFKSETRKKICTFFRWKFLIMRVLKNFSRKLWVNSVNQKPEFDLFSNNFSYAISGNLFKMK